MKTTDTAMITERRKTLTRREARYRKSRKARNAKSTNKKITTRLMRISIFVVVFAIGFTSSRYVTTLDNEQVLVPENFYFESNYLLETEEDEEIVRYNVYTDYVDFEIRNHDLIQYAENDITYTIAVSTGDESVKADVVKIVDGSEDKTEDKPYTLSSSNTITSGDTAYAVGFDSDTFRLTADEGAIVTVTATSSDPYVKTITAVFKFQDPGNKTFYEIVDMGYYCYLNIYTGEDLAEDDIGFDVVTIKYVTEIFSPDNQNPFMEDWKIDALYVYEEDEATGKYKIKTNDERNLVTTADASVVQYGYIDIYDGDTGEDDAVTPEETELVPNGYYSFVFFENTLGDYTQGQFLLDEDTGYIVDDDTDYVLSAENSYTIIMPTTSTEKEVDEDE